jgi:hypothetical protein
MDTRNFPDPPEEEVGEPLDSELVEEPTDEELKKVEEELENEDNN